MKGFPPNGYVEFKWKSTLNVHDHKTLQNQCNSQSSMMTELMLQMYTLAVVENKRGCAQMCDAVSKSDIVFKIAALKAAFKNFKLSSEIFRYMSENLFKLPYFKFPTSHCPELEAVTVTCFATMNQAMTLMCATGTAILEEKEAIFIAKLAKNAYEKFELLIGPNGQMEAFSGKTGLTYMNLPKPNLFSWAKLCKPIYYSIYAYHYGKVYFEQDGERNKRLGITMVREADKAAKEYTSVVKSQKDQKWNESTLMFLARYQEMIILKCKAIEEQNTVYYASALPLNEVPDLETPEVLARNTYQPVGFEQLMSSV